ncbi:MAG: sigma-70 family RNA polymerase sigma factor, partial [Actinobacteria bacterium]|nr:sigma-70 family RNA polymerase sigma factor [Actinomycetota bacterium]
SLHRAHGGVAREVAYRVHRDRGLAEDAVQEGFLDLWRTADRFDTGRASVRAWLCVLVHRRAVDRVRVEARKHAMTERLSSIADADSYTAEELVVLRDDHMRLRAALLDLSKPQREVLELAYWGGLSQSELAERFGVPLGTVKSRTFKALRQLRLVLGAPSELAIPLPDG